MPLTSGVSTCFSPYNATDMLWWWWHPESAAPVRTVFHWPMECPFGYHPAMAPTWSDLVMFPESVLEQYAIDQREGPLVSHPTMPPTWCEFVVMLCENVLQFVSVGENANICICCQHKRSWSRRYCYSLEDVKLWRQSQRLYVLLGLNVSVTNHIVGLNVSVTKYIVVTPVRF